MIALEERRSAGEVLEKTLLLRTSPLAVKLLEKEEDIPEGALRPKRDLGVHLAQCQAFAMSRREGEMVAILKEDNWCWAPLIGYGLVEPPEIFLKGKPLFPNMVADPEAAKNYIIECLFFIRSWALDVGCWAFIVIINPIGHQ